MFIYEKSILQSNEHQCSIHVCECFFFYVRVRVRVRVHVCGADTEYNPQKQTLFNLIKLCFITEENIFFLIK